MKLKIILAIAALALSVAPLTAGQGSAAPRISPPNSNTHGKTLTEWLYTYWEWNYSGADLSKSVIDGVQMMPLPAGEYISGAGTWDDPALYKGKLEITLPPGTPFVLPEFAWTVERYEGYPAVPDDHAIPDNLLLEGVSPLTLTIDGKTVMSDSNKAEFYVPVTPFDPIVVYPTPSSYGSVAAVSFQGCGLVSPPLSVGKHTIHLYEVFSVPPFAEWPGFPGFGVIYDNTWVITVKPGK